MLSNNKAQLPPPWSADTAFLGPGNDRTTAPWTHPGGTSNKAIVTITRFENDGEPRHRPLMTRVPVGNTAKFARLCQPPAPTQQTGSQLFQRIPRHRPARAQARRFPVRPKLQTTRPPPQELPRWPRRHPSKQPQKSAAQASENAADLPPAPERSCGEQCSQGRDEKDGLYLRTPNTTEIRNKALISNEKIAGPPIGPP